MAMPSSYFHFRFDAERLQSQVQISRLLDDADIVERAIRKSTSDQTRTQHDRNIVASSPSPGDSNIGKGKGLRGAGRSTIDDGGSPSMGARTGDGGPSNAYVEPFPPKEDPDFISMKQASRRRGRSCSALVVAVAFVQPAKQYSVRRVLSYFVRGACLRD